MNEGRHAVNFWNLGRSCRSDRRSCHVLWNPAEEGGRRDNVLWAWCDAADARRCGAGDQLGDVIDRDANGTTPKLSRWCKACFTGHYLFGDPAGEGAKSLRTYSRINVFVERIGLMGAIGLIGPMNAVFF